MKATLSATVIKKLAPGSYDVYDTVQPRLVLRVRDSGKHSYLLNLGRGKWYTLGLQTDLVPDKARQLAQKALGLHADGVDLIAEKRKAAGRLTFDAFLTERYEPWALAHLKHGDDALTRIRLHFAPLFGSKPLAEVDGFAVERWRAKRLKGDAKGNGAVDANTTNRDLACLKASLSKAVEWGLLNEHPLRRVKPSKVDHAKAVRFLSADEEKRLRAALAARDDTRRTERTRANDWRRERGYPEFPEMGVYSDHLAPVVLLALNTGMRRGELLNLRWPDVDLVAARLTVRGEGAKSGRTRHLPLNAEAVAVLKAWGPQTDGLVFPGEDGEAMFSLKTAWAKVATAATLKDFRFHDLRHTFASKLVQRGVDLNTVRELLGHSDIKMTLRYAHLAPENLAAAVAKLG